MKRGERNTSAEMGEVYESVMAKCYRFTLTNLRGDQLCVAAVAIGVISARSTRFLPLCLAS
jgi:hypothetical protein